MRSALLILALTFWTALANPLPHNSTSSLLRREDNPIRKYVCSPSTDKADRPRSCQGLVAKIKELRAKHKEKGKNQLFHAELQDRKLCDGQCCISWSPNGDLLTIGELFILYNLMRKDSGCPTSKPVQWIDQTRGYALCLTGKGNECEYDDPLRRYVDEEDCPEGCYFDIVVDEDAVEVDAIGGSGNGRGNPIEKTATAFNMEQLAGQALDRCKEGGCKSKSITDGVTYEYYCNKKKPKAQCHILKPWNGGLGPHSVRVSTYWEVMPEGKAAREKMVEVMKTALKQTVQKVQDRQVRLNADDWFGITYERVPKNFQVAIRGIPQKGKNSQGNIAKLVMGIASCDDSPVPWECGNSIGKLAADTALFFMGPISVAMGAANSISCGSIGGSGRIKCEQGQAYNL